MTEIEYKRKCDNWIETFKSWTMPRSEASETFITWTGIWTLAATLRRQVFIPKKELGSWTCYPYLYVMFVAPAGMRKTTTIGYSVDLLGAMSMLPPPPTFITKEALIQDFINAQDASIYLIVEEFSDLIMKGGDEMFEFLTSMYDGKKELRQKTLARGLEHAERPCLNMLAATTPRWIADKIPAHATEGGFASRVVWVYEDKVRQRRMYYRDVDQKLVEQKQKDLIADLTHISKLNGEFKLDEDAAVWMEAWYQKHESASNAARLKRYPGYLNRKPVIIHKVAMLLHIAKSDTLVLTIDDFKDAIRIVEATEPNLPKVFTGVGKNEFALEMRDIVAFVKEQGEVSESELNSYFQHIATPIKLNELISGLLLSEDLQSEQTERGRIFKPGDD
jgi:hypothetical protein